MIKIDCEIVEKVSVIDPILAEQLDVRLCLWTINTL